MYFLVAYFNAKIDLHVSLKNKNNVEMVFSHFHSCSPLGINIPNIFFTLFLAGTGYPGGGFYLPNVTNPQVVGTLRGRLTFFTSS